MITPLMLKERTAKLKQKNGFTIVELLIVMTIIAILAAICMVAYTGVAAKARDASRRSSLEDISKALAVYKQDTNTTIEKDSGCGMWINGSGWLNVGPEDGLGSDLYKRSIIDCLQDRKLLGSGDYADPSGCKWDGPDHGKCGVFGNNTKPAQAFMKATCTTKGENNTYLYAHLETLPRKDAEIDALCDAGTVPGFDSYNQRWGSFYGMNYAVKVPR